METSYVAKGQRLFDAAGLSECFKPGDRVAIKVHCGELFNTNYLRPSIVRGIVDKVKECGGRPFVCDTTTLYIGFRCNAMDEYYTANYNGFNEATFGCPFVVADGNHGTDDVEVKIPNGAILNRTYVARAIAEADASIVVSHFKGHPMGVTGGALKNMGIGGMSKRGKYVTHLSRHPKYGPNRVGFHPEKCKGSACPKAVSCVEMCPVDTVQVTKSGIKWDIEACAGCHIHCFLAWIQCPEGVYEGATEESFLAFNAAMADSAWAYVKALGKDRVGFINFAVDMGPVCDCLPFGDQPIIPNLGAFASKDPVAVDRACLDMSMKVEGIVSSAAEDFKVLQPGTEKFTKTAVPTMGGMEVSQWATVNAGAAIGLGSKEYELVKVDPAPLGAHRPFYKGHHVAWFVKKSFTEIATDPNVWKPDLKIPPERLRKP